MIFIQTFPAIQTGFRPARTAKVAETLPGRFVVELFNPGGDMHVKRVYETQEQAVAMCDAWTRPRRIVM